MKWVTLYPPGSNRPLAGAVDLLRTAGNNVHPGVGRKSDFLSDGCGLRGVPAAPGLFCEPGTPVGPGMQQAPIKRLLTVD